ncbi:hypothetical protein [Mesorhizobium sp. M1406]|uniref:hypothetical protein n=1 Tax=Mesorhizobium sp. M1406 TaxID=2957099 RepID=UPI0033351939
MAGHGATLTIQEKRVAKALLKKGWANQDVQAWINGNRKKSVNFARKGNDHIRAWRHYQVRPKTKAAHPENTNKEYCLYHAAHGDYTYAQAWVDKLAGDIGDPVKLAAIRAVKVW